MIDEGVLHIRISRNMIKEIDKLVDKGLFSNKNEIMRASIRSIILKYKDETKK